MRLTLNEHETAEERRLWAEYYEATARALEIIKSEGTDADALSRIVAQHEIAHRAIERIKEVRGTR